MCWVTNPHWIGNGNCDGGSYNTAECEFDGGDCDCIVNYPWRIGDGNCNGGSYNTIDCGFDGGDCEEFNAKYPNCNVEYPWKIRDGRCHGGAYNTAECGFDGGDCEEFNAKYPNCSSPYPILIGNGDCDNYGSYNTAECGFDEGDCEFFNKYPNCIASYDLARDGICDSFYNTAECGFDGGDCGRVPVSSIVGGVAGALLFIAIGNDIWKRKRNTSTMQQEIAGGGGVQAGNARVQGSNQSIADNAATSPSAPTQNETREQKQHNRRFKILTSILQKVRFCQQQ